MLIGLPGSGKSYLADKYTHEGFVVHSSDAIREELTGDVNNQRANSDVFSVLHRRIKDDLAAGIDCVYDATNINYKQRMEFLKYLNNVECMKEAVVVCTPYETCLLQNEQRERKVPAEVIDRMYRRFTIPYYYEGWDKITLHYHKEEYKKLYGPPGKFLFDTCDYSQENKHHSATLGEHCRLAVQYLIHNFVTESVLDTTLITLSEAAMLHDCGKPFCQTFKNTRGEITTEAHYYDHQYVGGYNALFYDMNSADKLYVSLLIMWHMQLYFSKEGSSSYNKYVKLWGYKLFKDLLWLHKADLAAH